MTSRPVLDLGQQAFFDQPSDRVITADHPVTE
jgi:hypothetical protein